MSDPTEPVGSKGEEDAATSSGVAGGDGPNEDALFDAEVRATRRKLLLVAAGGMLAFSAFCFGVTVGYPCASLYVAHGLWVDQCPTSDMRLGLELDASRVRRGGKGNVVVHTYARYYDQMGHAAPLRTRTLPRGVDLALSVIDSDGEVVEGARFEGPQEGSRSRHVYSVELPADLVDGDYTLRLEAEAPFETAVAEMNLALYAPALVHVASDRPLYKPGQEVMLRAVLLDRTDLTPLDKRPGRWTVTSPSGQKMLVEKDRAAAFGVADTSFPLDGAAEEGTWSATFASGEASDRITFEVRPFQLPRFAVELAPTARWYGIGDELAFEGTARYTSGAPVASAPVSVTLSAVEGRWPMPLGWEEPISTETDAFGRFSVTIGEVPADLLERNVFRATARVTEEAGTVIAGGARAILSVDDLMAEIVTELGDGLVGGFNNRAYLRVMTPDERPLPGAKVQVWPAHDELAERKEDVADADGVAAIQLDPGDPITVVIPAPPVRERPFEPPKPWVQSGQDVMRSSGFSLEERSRLDRLVPAVARCGDFSRGGEAVSVGLRVSATGVPSRVMHGSRVIERCVGEAMRGVRMPPGSERTYAVTWQVPDTLRPYVETSVSSAIGDGSPVRRAVERAAVEARRCMPFGSGMSGAVPVEAHWTMTRGSRFVETRVTTHGPGSGLSPTEVGCVASGVGRLQLVEPASADAMGTLRLSLTTPTRPGAAKPQPMTRTAYELAVAAEVDGSEIGDTRLVLSPGQIPALRLRATPTLAMPGEEVVVDVLRGPSFRGQLPDKASLMKGSAQVVEAEVDLEKRQVRFPLPQDASGFLHVDIGGARAVVFVRRPDPLSVDLTSDRDVYRPGEEARLTVTTKEGDKAVQAAVGLSGVDQTLGQLAPLLGPDDWGRITVRATSERPAFGSFDPRALTLGQVRGDNAAMAALLRISQLPDDYAGDVLVSGSGATVPNDIELLTRHFYRALVVLHDKVRGWESAAADGVVLTNPEMVRLWSASLEELEQVGDPAVDAFGRRLTLSMLPDDLLSQCDPRQVVADATHLPEDIEDWTAWVRKEAR